MTDLICKCGALIPDAEINAYNNCGDDGDWIEANCRCLPCNQYFEVSDWASGCDFIEDAKECLQIKINES